MSSNQQEARLQRTISRWNDWGGQAGGKTEENERTSLKNENNLGSRPSPAADGQSTVRCGGSRRLRENGTIQQNCRLERRATALLLERTSKEFWKLEDDKKMSRSFGGVPSAAPKTHTIKITVLFQRVQGIRNKEAMAKVTKPGPWDRSMGRSSSWGKMNEPKI